MAVAKVYRSKIDAWLLVVLIAAMAVSGFGALQSISAGTTGGWLTGIAIALIGIGLPLWLLLATYYRFETGELIVRCGPFRWRIPISEIVEVVPTSNPISSPALSLDRLKIVFGAGRTLLVSPREKEEFRGEIESRRLAL
jgi:TM2 domain-containing membrane protein YozV